MPAAIATDRHTDRTFLPFFIFCMAFSPSKLNFLCSTAARAGFPVRHAHGLSSHRRACSHGRNQKTFPNHPTFPVRIKFPCYLSSRPVRPVNAPLRKHRTPFLRSRPPRRRPRCSALGALLSPRASPGRYPLPMPLFSCRPRFGHLKRAKARWIPKGGSS